MAKERILLTLTPGLRARVDEARGETPRTQWIERAIEQALGIGDMEITAVSRDRLSRAARPRRSNGPPERIPTISVSPDPVSAPAESLSPIEAYRRRLDAIDRAYRPPKK
jgi:hypothetical protein